MHAGKFKDELNDDVTDFTPEQFEDLVKWRDFYMNHKARNAQSASPPMDRLDRCRHLTSPTAPCCCSLHILCVSS